MQLKFVLEAAKVSLQRWILEALLSLAKSLGAQVLPPSAEL